MALILTLRAFGGFIYHIILIRLLTAFRFPFPLTITETNIIVLIASAAAATAAVD